MRFSDFLDTLYVNKNIELQSDGFTLKKQAETRAIQDLINGQRKWFKLMAYFSLTYMFFVCQLTEKWPSRKEFPKPGPKLVPPENPVA